AAISAVSLGVYQNLLRRIRESSGKVRTAEFDIPDLLVTIVLVGYFALLIPQGFSQPPPAETASLKPADILLNASVFLILAIGIAAFLYTRGVSLKHLLGFDRLPIGRALLVAFGLVLAAFPVVLAASFLIQNLLHEPAHEQDLVTLFRDVSRKNNYSLIGTILFTGVIVAPLSEEFLFRGYFYGAIKRYCGAPVSAIFTSALFALVHLNLSSLPSLFVLALCLTIAYEATGSLAVPMSMHALFNLSQLVTLYFRSHAG
ncbi:MAG: amino terminal protease self-immunity, partial [Chthoniobacteraceae bacterium]|nr:amino terminal protease self-immunity [Chthoniobacteraceae bacterium]